jgi:hypothetical protein
LGCNPFSLNAGVHFTVPVDSKNFKFRVKSVVRAAPYALKFVLRNIVTFKKCFAVLHVFFRNAEGAIETIFATGRCK